MVCIICAKEFSQLPILSDLDIRSRLHIRARRFRDCRDHACRNGIQLGDRRCASHLAAIRDREFDILLWTECSPTKRRLRSFLYGIRFRRPRMRFDLRRSSGRGCDGASGSRASVSRNGSHLHFGRRVANSAAKRHAIITQVRYAPLERERLALAVRVVDRESSGVANACSVKEIKI